MQTLFRKRHIVIYLLVIICLSSFVLNLTGAARESQTTDEGAHLVAGYSYLTTGDYRLNPEHPPLLKILAAFPLLFMEIDMDFSGNSWENADQWALANQLLYQSENNADWLLFWGRFINTLFSLGLILLVFFLTKKYFSQIAGLIAATLTAFEPLVLSHGHYVTTDVTIAFFMLLAIYYFTRFLENPKVKNGLIFALIFTLAMLIKFSAVLLVPICLLIFMIYFFLASKEKKHKFKFKNILITLLLIIVIFIGLGLLTYNFQAVRPFDDPETIKLWEQEEIPHYGFIESAFNKNIPGYYWFKGLIMVQQHSKWGHYSYILGNFDEHGGWWYYFPLAFLIKTPLITLGFILLALMISLKALLKNRRQLNLKKIPLIYISLLTFILFYFLYSMNNNINLGVRHLLPIYPAIFILLGGVISNLKFTNPKQNKIYYTLITLILIGYAGTAFIIWPHYLSYFNQLIGGSSNGYKYLSDSNLDWGQDLKNLQIYVEKNNIPEIYSRVSGWAGTQYYNINSLHLPTNQEILNTDFSGYVAISISYLNLEKPEYSWLWQFEPIHIIGNSIYVYKII